MGYWMGLCIFDYSAFTKTVIPALQAGETHSLVNRTIELLNTSYRHFQCSTCDFKGLSQVMAAFDPHMVYCSLGKDFYVCNGEIVEKDRLSKANEYWNYEDLVDLLGWMVSRYAITHYYVFGQHPYCLEDLFCRSEVRVINEDLANPAERSGFHRIPMSLLDSLDTHGNNSWEFDGGVCGWLDPIETELLLISMQDLPVQTEAPYPPDSLTFQQLYKDCGSRELYERHWNKLDTFRCIVKMAVDLKHGLLWGRDLDLFYSNTLFYNGENTPVDLGDILDTKKSDLSP